MNITDIKNKLIYKLEIIKLIEKIDEYKESDIFESFLFLRSRLVDELLNDDENENIDIKEYRSFIFSICSIYDWSRVKVYRKNILKRLAELPTNNTDFEYYYLPDNDKLRYEIERVYSYDHNIEEIAKDLFEFKETEREFFYDT